MGFTNSWLTKVIKIQKTKCIPVIFIDTAQLKWAFLGFYLQEFFPLYFDSINMHKGLSMES